MRISDWSSDVCSSDLSLRQLSAEGVSILYISHKLEEIRALCDRATIRRGGRVVAECDPRAETARSLAQMMIGTELKTVVRRDAGTTGTVRLAVDGLSVAAEALHGIDLKDISFDVRAGEVFGIAGVAGNGQNELLLALSRSEEHTYELQSLMRSSYAVFCLKKNTH